MTSHVPDFGNQFTRRQVLRATLSATAAPVLAWAQRPVSAGESDDGLAAAAANRVLVVIQLTGGNDTLNTIIPFQESAYHTARPTLRIVAEKAIPVNDFLAFHPALRPLKEVFAAGRLAILQAVGYPHSSRDHDVALRDWHSATPGDAVERTGWIGRTCDYLALQNPAMVHALFVGTMKIPQAVVGQRFIVPRIRQLSDLFSRETAFEPPHSPSHRGGKLASSDVARSLKEYLRHTAQQAYLLQRKALEVAEKFDTTSESTRFELERRLLLIARLIEAEVGTRIYFTDFGGPPPGGFDTHANQLENHHALLTELAWSLRRFVDIAQRRGILDRVLVLTFSEFGRTLAENGRHGTDHGAASSLFALGGAVKGGILGEHPSLTDLDQGGLKVHTDFRAVYAAVLEKWLGIPARPILGDCPRQVADFIDA